MGNPGRNMANQARERVQRRKEEFLGARVPKELRDKVIKRAENEGIPVSILIRKILEQAFAGDVSSVTPVAQAPTSPALSRATLHRFSNVLGWETISLHQRVSCGSCSKVLAAGHKAVVGFLTTGGPPVTLCQECYSIITRDNLP